MRYGATHLWLASLATGLGALFTVARAGAVETRGDVETDHASAAGDRDPGDAGVLINTLPIAMGWFTGEVDAALGRRAAFTLAGGGRVGGITGYEAAFGVAIFPQRVFHGFYARPQAEWAHEEAFGVSATAVGGVLMVGYEWTAPAGATLRLGGGEGYAKAIVSAPGQALQLGGWQTELEANLGWVF